MVVSRRARTRSVGYGLVSDSVEERAFVYPSLVRGLVLVVVGLVGCAHSKPVATMPIEKIKLLALPTESDAFPTIASAATAALDHAQVHGVDEHGTTKVSIEVVQLSIECVDPSASCYEAVAKSLAANKLLFAQIDVDGTKPKVSVTLFDRANRAVRTVAHTFATEADAVAGVDGLVVEATR